MNAITVDNVSKRFKLPHEKKTTLFQNIVGLIKRQLTYEELWALREVSFEVGRGETLGIIGRNGSGKSTLLKMLARVMYPDRGSVSVNGRLASFLELGVGFQPELTAQENVYIYSSILGVGRRQVDRMYEDIFDFAELKKFENMKLKNFSSGMYLRLAFATAIHTGPEILLIDEVFAVGDKPFQKKCAEKINEFQKNGRTIVFVSHALDAVKDLCQKSLLLENGRIVSAGKTTRVINDYLVRLKGEESHA
jgi:lipopolysaccharide transport system ATP-binding protein